ncbi:MAG: HAMP domain-containing sensor histidine kinase [Chloroflexota bacterium]
MTIPPIDLNTIMIAAQVTKVLNVIHRVAYALISPELTVLYASPNFTNVLSEPTHNLFGSRLEDVVWEFVGIEENLKAILNGRLPFLALERINREMSGGHTLYLDMNVTPFKSSDMEPGLLLIVEDVTEQAVMEQRLTQSRNELLLVREQLFQANEDLLQLNRIKSLFLSIAVHDLRTPLTTIRAYSDLMLHQQSLKTNPKLIEYTEIIQKQAIRMDWLIDDVLDLDAVEQGKLSLRFETLDLNSVVSQVVDMLAYLAEKRRQSLSLHLWPNDIVFLLDENRLQQILYNLISNAIKYTPTDGKIVVSTRVEGETAVIQVTDNGPGLTATQQAAAFSLYYRTEDADSYDTTGRGLGLFIVKMLAEAHGGSVDLISEPSSGSTFRVYLPM